MKRISFLAVIVILAAGLLPAHAQSDGEIQLRIVNLFPEATMISVIPSTQSGQLEQIDFADPAPAASPYYPLPVDVNGLGVSITRTSGFGGGGFTAEFVAGHSYLLLVTPGEDNSGERVLIDESGPFGGLESPAMQGLARVMFINSVPGSLVAYRLQDSAGNHVLTQIPTAERFGDAPPLTGTGVTAGDYVLAIVAADTGAVLKDGIALSLAGDQWTGVILTGTSTDDAQAFVLGSELTPVN